MASNLKWECLLVAAINEIQHPNDPSANKDTQPENLAQRYATLVAYRTQLAFSKQIMWGNEALSASGIRVCVFTIFADEDEFPDVLLLLAAKLTVSGHYGSPIDMYVLIKLLSQAL